ncbi:chromosome partitioning protein, ParB family [Quadrisphaera granulorum]|uniref:ParB family chromosome partitioning protein n=1 Tax=Quadrisphaera granulorum TaxID=317664 RepID=A0A316AER8_9ACTN|nr:ParB/RepB/Spo0J family partition protein [Quadrisphaera granulorum]PWJ55768.1 ParB family chromosome partitioning protein [Quadrisphaera granulorum]SZE95265.1 chromosome partitioning protein, ParB family [Quadrisphaera granulorum]
MTERKRGLGRGLGALIPDAVSPEVTGQLRSVSASDRPYTARHADRAGSADRLARPELRDVRPEKDGDDDGDLVIDLRDGAPVPSSWQAPRRPGARGARGGASDQDLLPIPGTWFAEVPIGSVSPNPRQPRQVFDEDAHAELVHSVKEIGILQPVVVRPLRRADGSAPPPGEQMSFELVMGERRWRAAESAGLATVPAIVRDTTDEDLLRDALLENLHRADLNPLEEAAAYQQLLDDFGCTHDSLAQRLGRSRPQISNTIRLLRLPPSVARRVAAGVLSAGHARALLGLPTADAMERLAQRIVAEGLSVRTTEELVALGGVGPARPARPQVRTAAPVLDDLAARLSDRFDTRVSVAMGAKKGRLTVEFATLEDLDRILGSLAPGEAGVAQTPSGDAEHAGGPYESSSAL